MTESSSECTGFYSYNRTEYGIPFLLFYFWDQKHTSLIFTLFENFSKSNRPKTASAAQYGTNAHRPA